MQGNSVANQENPTIATLRNQLYYNTLQNHMFCNANLQRIFSLLRH